mgnify:CR=1 FL=1
MGVLAFVYSLTASENTGTGTMFPYWKQHPCPRVSMRGNKK